MIGGSLVYFLGCVTNSAFTDHSDTTGTKPTKKQIAIYSAAPFNFSDPNPARPWLQADGYKYFYSTQSKIMYCKVPVSPNSFVKAAPIRIDKGVLKQYIENDGITIHGYWGKNVYQDSSGNWHMLVEGANLMRIKGKYVMVYSVGGFARDNYKIGLAWSDHLLGPYKKVLRKDEKNIWSNGAGKPEVQYLLQTQKSRWPDYVKEQVKGPGVGSIERDSNGKWYLFFAGYNPSTTKKPNGKYRPSQRHPFYVLLNVNVRDKSVNNTTSYELQDWITPVRH